MNVIDKIEKDQMEKILAERSLPEFGAGDTLKVDVKIVEVTRREFTHLKAFVLLEVVVA